RKEQYKASSANLRHSPSDPFTIPGRPTSLNPQFSAFIAPNGSPVPRGLNNFLILSEPHIDMKGRKSWPSHNFNSAYVQ
ncbi:Bgt-50417, partial [Blumeria graminis f. sp. tritici]